ncbi:hypothetical protein KCU77_g62, partial [Aureobasidium melanogenum]
MNFFENQASLSEQISSGAIKMHMEALCSQRLLCILIATCRRVLRSVEMHDEVRDEVLYNSGSRAGRCSNSIESGIEVETAKKKKEKKEKKKKRNQRQEFDVREALHRTMTYKKEHTMTYKISTH